MIALKHIRPDDKDSIKILIDYKRKLMDYHLRFAEQLGISDEEIKNYSDSQAVATLEERESLLIILNGKAIGYIQFEIKKSIVGNDNVIFIHGIYIDKDYRDLSYGIVACKQLYEKYKLGIECQCWYNLPAAKVYEKIGFINLFTYYYLPFK